MYKVSVYKAVKFQIKIPKVDEKTVENYRGLLFCRTL